MPLTLYELGGPRGQRYSQFSWRTHLALAHKGLTAESIPVGISDKDAIAFSKQDKVPILRDGNKVIADSWAIAEHLEAAYPDRPSLFGGEVGHAYSRFINAWVDRQLVPKLVVMTMIDVVGMLNEADSAHLRGVIETTFKNSLETLSATRDKDVVAFRRLLDPARITLRQQPFLSGPAPAYPDYILFSMLQWVRITSTFALLDPADTLVAWRERMLDLYGGLARGEPSRQAA